MDAPFRDRGYRLNINKKKGGPFDKEGVRSSESLELTESFKAETRRRFRDLRGKKSEAPLSTATRFSDSVPKDAWAEQEGYKKKG